jgi:hypothetical protein
VTAPAWTDAHLQDALDRLRSGESYAEVAAAYRVPEQRVRDEVARARAAGMVATGARRQMQKGLPPRACAACRGPFTPRTRFIVRCDECLKAHAGVYA